jgi:para-nitrobenzyl esterase
MESCVRNFCAAALASFLTAGPVIKEQASASSGIDVVKVEGGRVSGVETDVKGVKLFKGVPFAGPTSGANRFKPPQPVISWEGVKASDSWGDRQIQPPNNNPVGTFWGDEFYFDTAYTPKVSEDAQRLNVWTPAKSTSEKLPVYVWIHGGGNHHGHASEMEFVASKLAAKGIIVVSLQYRVGALGYLALKELSAESPHGVSGNYGILDIIKTLQWVHDNIAAFGGDPSSVTVGGQSAGAQNATMLLRTPLAKGLFKRAVLESGFQGFLPVPMMDLKEREAANQKAADGVFGKPTSLADLRAMTIDDFATNKTADGKLLIYNALHGATNTAPTTPFTLDGYVFTKDSVDLLRPGALDGYDIMIGGTSDEYASLDNGPDKQFSAEELATAMQKIGYDDSWKAVYRPSGDLEAYRMSLRAKSDYFLQDYLVSAEYAKAHNTRLNIYSYYFNTSPPGRNSEFYGAFHSSDLWYFFNSIRDMPGQRSWTGADHRLAETMSSYLANFVKTGNPNGEGLSHWEQTSAANKGAFMWFRDGYARLVNETPYADRDELNRKTVLRKANLGEKDLVR